MHFCANCKFFKYLSFCIKEQLWKLDPGNKTEDNWNASLFHTSHIIWLLLCFFNEFFMLWYAWNSTFVFLLFSSFHFFLTVVEKEFTMHAIFIFSLFFWFWLHNFYCALLEEKMRYAYKMKKWWNFLIAFFEVDFTFFSKFSFTFCHCSL